MIRAVLDEAALQAWGERIGGMIATPVFIALRGDLGAGKSVLARSIAKGAGVNAMMPSPTYNLVFRYGADEGRSIVHMDLYRLERAQDVWELGWRELGGEGEIALVEWPERAESLLPAERWEIQLEPTEPHLRSVLAHALGAVPPLPHPDDVHADRA